MTVFGGGFLVKLEGIVSSCGGAVYGFGNGAVEIGLQFKLELLMRDAAAAFDVVFVPG